MRALGRAYALLGAALLTAVLAAHVSIAIERPAS